MSWLSEAGDWIGSAFDSGADAVASAAPTVASAAAGSGGGNSGLYSALIGAGTSLAGIYFKQTGDKSLAEEAAKQRMAELAYMEANKSPAGGGGGGGGGSDLALKLARMNNLSALYQNWAQIVEKGGEAQASAALKTGELMTNPIMARAGVLR